MSGSISNSLEMLKRVRLEGRGIPLRGNDIDTDRIVPARFLKETRFDNMGKYVFYDERFDDQGNPKQHPFNDRRYQGASVLVVESNFGCGSSREHAAQAVMRFGIQAVIGVSFSEIFSGNCKANGIPVVTASKEDIEILLNGLEKHSQTVFILDLESKTVCWDTVIKRIDLPEDRRQAFLTGTWDPTAMLKSNWDKIQKVAQSLPY